MIYYIIYFIMFCITYIILSVNIDPDREDFSGSMFAIISLFCPIVLPAILLMFIAAGFDKLSRKIYNNFNKKDSDKK